jgi:tetratricopeptide (TPR) repeat protein
LHDFSPFSVLGIPIGSDAGAVRKAYRQRVRECHPDLFQNPEEQKAAQERLVALNLAYAEALRICGSRRVGFNLISPEEAKHFAKKLMEQGNLESALRQLNRADRKDADFFYIQGNILMRMEQFDTAYQSYREAVRLGPGENRYRRGALEASLAIKRSRMLWYRVGKWVREILGQGKK